MFFRDSFISPSKFLILIIDNFKKREKWNLKNFITSNTGVEKI